MPTRERFCGGSRGVHSIGDGVGIVDLEHEARVLVMREVDHEHAVVIMDIPELLGVAFAERPDLEPPGKPGAI